MDRDVRFLALANKRDWLYSRATNVAYSGERQGIALMPWAALSKEGSVAFGAFSWETLPQTAHIAMAADAFGRIHLGARNGGKLEYWIYDDRLKRAEKNAFIPEHMDEISQIVCSRDFVFAVPPAKARAAYAFDPYTSQLIWDLGKQPRPSGGLPPGFGPLCAAYAGNGQAILLAGAEGAGPGARLCIARASRSGECELLWQREGAGASDENARLTGPFDIACIGSGSLYILDRAEKRILRFSPGSGDPELLCKLSPSFTYSGLGAGADGYLYTAAWPNGAAADGYICRLDPLNTKAGSMSPAEHALTGYVGAIDGFAIDKKNSRLIVLDKGSAAVSIFSVQTGYRAGTDGIASGSIMPLEPFDSLVKGNRWQRIALDASCDRERGDGISISYLATDEDLGPDEVAFERKKPMTADALVDACGRYLWVKLELTGSHASSPAVRHIKAYFKGHGYLDYLPAIYRRDAPPDSDMLYRFLSVFETMLSQMEHRIDNITELFDPNGGDPRFLAWLSQWLAIPDAERAVAGKNLGRLVGSAARLYKIRGTRAYLEELAELLVSRRAIVVERVRLQEMCGDGSPLSDVLLPLYGSDPCAFFLLVSPFATDDGGRAVYEPLQRPARMALNEAVRLESPVCTVGNTVFLEPYVGLDRHTYLGVNTSLLEPVPLLGDNTYIGGPAAMKDRRDDGALEIHSLADDISELT